MTPVLATLAPSKLATFADTAKNLDATALRTDVNPPKRWVLLACLVHQAHVQERDDLADMFIEYVQQKHKVAQAALAALRERQRETVEQFLTLLIAGSADEGHSPALGIGRDPAGSADPPPTD
jgi:hypothetical protein